MVNKDTKVAETKAADTKAEEAEPKFGKVEARIAALEAYLAKHAKANGWPEFKG